jgi:S1-C subfamily serine protease
LTIKSNDFPKNFFSIISIILIISVSAGYLIALNTRPSQQQILQQIHEVTSNISDRQEDVIMRVSELESSIEKLGRENVELKDSLEHIEFNSTYTQFMEFSDSVVSITVGIVQSGFLGFASGSGFVFNDEGYIVTNYHVIESFEASIGIEVEFFDGTIVKGKFVASDPDSDLAVLKVELPEGIDPLSIGNSSAVEVGEEVLAIGNPFGLGGTLTTGIVSQTKRSLDTASGFLIPNVIQVDAAINPGNSGGPLLNINGEVIGVNTAGVPKSVGEGIGFAIPSNIVSRVVPILIEEGEYKHNFIGISGIQVNLAIAEVMNINTTKGVLVLFVEEDSPAAEAGIIGGNQNITIQGFPLNIGGDVITHIDNAEMIHFIDILSYIEEHKRPGDIIELKILRHGKRMKLSLALGER